MDSNKCKSCHKDFKRLRKHLVQNATCKELYSEEEIKAIATLKKSAQNRRFLKKNKKEKAHCISTTCKSCNKVFEHLTQHLAKKPTCKQIYSEEEVKSITKMKKCAKNRRFHIKNKEKSKKEKAEYNSTYYLANREELLKKKNIQPQKSAIKSQKKVQNSQKQP